MYSFGITTPFNLALHHCLQFKQGTWYAVEKFGTKQAKCVTYDFQEDDFGFREVVQHSENTLMERLTFDNNVRYVGKLASTSSSTPADMIVRFQLSECACLSCCDNIEKIINYTSKFKITI